MKRHTRIVAVLSGLAIVAPSWAAIIHVPGDQPTIQAGIDAASDGDEVVIANGTWTGADNKNLDFGGRNITVRSDSGDPNLCIIDCEDDGRGFYFHSGETADARVEGITVRNGLITGMPYMGGGVLCSSSSPTFDDCIFRNNVIDSGSGAGVCNDGGEPAFIDCLFIDNHFMSGGHGAAFCSIGGDVELIGCMIRDNLAGYGPSKGGGAYFDNGSALVVSCTFQGNYAGGGSANARGGGLASESANLIVCNCGFYGNYATPGGMPTSGYGGGMWCSGGEALILSCSFCDNHASGPMDGSGGGGGVYGDGSITLANCLFSNNGVGQVFGSCSGGGALIVGDSLVVNCTFVHNKLNYEAYGPPVGAGLCLDGASVANCIVWGNATVQGGGDPVASGIYGEGSASYSDVVPEWSGVGNISVDPMFVDPDGPDGDPETWQDNDYRLAPGSPCIDAGDNTAVPVDITTDLDGNPRFVDDPDTPDTGLGDPPIVDMGAYEFQLAPPCPEDVNGDGVVNVLDLLAVIAAWGNTTGPEDVNADGIVNVLDLLAVISAWGPC